MARKLIVFLLLVLAWSGLYLLSHEGGWPAFAFFFAPASPSARPLPQAWAGQQASVRLLAADSVSGEAPAAAPAGGGCAAEYSVQKGDTLGKIAERCGVRLAALKSLNPGLDNPNRIYPGQRLVIYGTAQKAETAASSKAMTSAAPGSSMWVEASGLPPGAEARVGMGLATAGFHTLAKARVGADGTLTTEVSVPGWAKAGDPAFILVTTRGEKAVQAVSESFVISP